MMKVAIIPARGGSKRIPRKNIRLFAGRPIITYSIRCARDSGLFDQVIVSTDDDETAAIAQAEGASVPFRRPAHLADDHATTTAVIAHAVDWLNRQGASPDYVCAMYPTAPLLQPKYLHEGFERLKASNASFCFSVTTFEFPIWRGVRIEPEGRVAPLFPQFIDSRSQDLEVAYHDAAQFYWSRGQAFLQEKMVYARNAVPLVVPRHLVQDIDTEEDWKMAELIYQLFQSPGRLEIQPDHQRPGQGSSIPG